MISLKNRRYGDHMGELGIDENSAYMSYSVVLE
jgi:hypothetical protein